MKNIQLNADSRRINQLRSEVTRLREENDKLHFANASLTAKFDDPIDVRQRLSIGENKRLRQALEYRNLQLQSILKALPDLFFLLDKEGRIVEFFNLKSELILGYRPEDLIERPILELDTMSSNFSLKNGLDEVLKNGNSFSHQITILEESKLVFFELRLTNFTQDRVIAILRRVSE